MQSRQAADALYDREGKIGNISEDFVTPFDSALLFPPITDLETFGKRKAVELRKIRAYLTGQTRSGLKAEQKKTCTDFLLGVSCDYDADQHFGLVPKIRLKRSRTFLSYYRHYQIYEDGMGSASWATVYVCADRQTGDVFVQSLATFYPTSERAAAENPTNPSATAAFPTSLLNADANVRFLAVYLDPKSDAVAFSTTGPAAYAIVRSVDRV